MANWTIECADRYLAVFYDYLHKYIYKSPVIHKLGEEKEGLTIAGCWAHARRRYDEAVKALPSKSRKSSIAWQALEQIQMIYHVDNTLKELKPEERKNADRVV